MGEWMTERGAHHAGLDYLRSALDLLYDVEEKVKPHCLLLAAAVSHRGPGVVS